MRQSTLKRRLRVALGATHRAFRAIGCAVALLHDDSRGLGIAHGRDIYVRERFRE
jgi:hypothetical protein